MRVKLIAVVVAGLFAQSAYADENWVWSGSAEVGGRGTNIDGANRNGGVGGSTASTTPALPVPLQGTGGRRQGAGVPGHRQRARSA